MATAKARSGRHLSWWQFIVVAVAYLAIIKVGGLIFGSGISGEDGFRTAHDLLRLTLIPVAISAVFAIAVASWLGWWPEIVRDGKPVQGWLRIVPIGLLLAAAVGTSWGNLFDQKTGLVVLFVLLVLIVGFTEELMFRGIGVVAFRRGGFPEAKVALYTSILFGAAHLSNAISDGPKALLQALLVSLSGYFFYLTKRWAGVIWVAMLVHSSQDFVLISGQVGVDSAMSAAAVLVPLTMVFLAVQIWRRRDRIEPEREAAPPSPATAPPA
ncbi:MAG: CPBP family intramembrane metalloprotease [Actinobacteria bacterium]|nr:CPBP family intramembrane metalloprotease [Actinomycetota bacterium]